MNRTPFWGNVLITTDNTCWKWLGLKYPKGYGVVRRNKKNISAHRYMYSIVKGEVGDNHVLHSCDNPGCVNPNHLFLGTNYDNVLDKLSKQRHPVGSKTTNAKLNEEDVRCIRDSRMDYKEVASKYEIDRKTAWNIVKGNTWKHVL